MAKNNPKRFAVTTLSGRTIGSVRSCMSDDGMQRRWMAWRGVGPDAVLLGRNFATKSEAIAAVEGI